jgi:hypothetical protein
LLTLQRNRYRELTKRARPQPAMAVLQVRFNWQSAPNARSTARWSGARIPVAKAVPNLGSGPIASLPINRERGDAK